MENNRASENDMERIAQEAAHSAVRELFKRFGVDIKDQVQINQFRDGVMFAYSLRKYTGVFIGALITAAAFGLWQIMGW